MTARPTTPAATPERLLVTVEDHVARVSLNRPEKLNALDASMFRALVAAAERLGEDPRVRAIVLCGEGRAFCAGLDVARFESMERGAGAADDLLTRQPGAPWNDSQRAAWVWRELRVPVVAAIHGVAYGAGLQIALGADVRLVSPDARLSLREVTWGLVPDLGASQLTRNTIRLDHLRELVFTGRVVSGTDAAALGLATRAVQDPHVAALELAREIAANSPSAVRAAKAILNEAPYASIADSLRHEEQHARQLVGSPDQQEAVRANREKRPAVFSDSV